MATRRPRRFRSVAPAGAEPLEPRLLLSGPAGSTELAWGINPAGYAITGVALDTAGNVYTTGNNADIAKYDPAGHLLWKVATALKVSNGSEVGQGYRLAVDGAGNVTVVGQFTGEADFDPGPGTTLLRSSPSLINPASSPFIVRFDTNGQFLWARSFVGAQGGRVEAVSLDATGNVYTTGSFLGTMDFDPGDGTYEFTGAGFEPGYTSDDTFISKLDSSGNFVWARTIGNPGNDDGYGIGVDGAGNVLVGGLFGGTEDFDPGPGIFNIMGEDGSFIPTGTFVLKLDAGGNFVWARQFAGKQGQFEPNGYITSQGEAFVQGLAVDAAGNVLTTGQFDYGVDFDPGPGVDLLDANRHGGSDGAFISKLDPSGNEVWARAITGFGETFGNSDIHGWAITADAAGNVYSTGQFGGSADFDPGPGSNVVISADFSHQARWGDIYMSKLDPQGNYVTAKTFAGYPGIDRGLAIATSAAGNVYISGDDEGQIDLIPSQPLAYRLNGGGPFLAKFAQVPTGQLMAVTPAARRTPVPSVDVLFSEPLGAGSFTLADLTLTRDGVALPLTGAALSALDSTSYRISGLDTLTVSDGAYSLFLNAAGVVDLEGQAGVGGSTVQWTVDNVAPAIIDVVDVSPKPYTVPGSVPEMRVVFSEPIDPSTFSAADLTLARDGTPVSLASATIGLELVSGSTYRITGLAPFLVADGAYTLTVRGDVADPTGNIGSGTSASESWLMAAPPVVTDVVDVAPDPRTTILSSVDVVFSEPIDLSTFGPADLALTLNGAPVALGAGVTMSFVSGTTYRISGLDGVITTNGAYTLTVNAAGINDLADHAGVGSASDAWTMDVPLTVADVLDVSPDPRNTAVDAIDVVFSRAVDPTSFTYLDVQLKQDGFSLTLDSRVVVTQLDARTFRISGLTPFTGLARTYLLTVYAEQVKDPAGKLGAGSASDTWVMETTKPTAFIADVAPKPRTAAVPSVTVSFSEPVTGLTASNFSLTRGGVAVPLTGATLTTADSKLWVLGNLAAATAPDGAYVLTLAAAGVTDLAGNALSAGDTETWSMDGTPPVMTLVPPVTPPFRASPLASVDFTVTDNVGVVSLASNTSMLSLTRDGVTIPLTGVAGMAVVSGTTYRILGLSDVTSPDGAYVLTIDGSKVKDTSGNTAANSLVVAWTNGRIAFNFAAPVVPGVPAALSGEIADPPGVPFAVRVDWGDGQVQSVNLPAGAATFAAAHTYARIGNLPVRVDVTQPAPHIDYATRIGGQGAEAANAVVHDAAGNTYLVGDFTFTMDADPGPGVVTLTNTNGSQDAFFAKYDAQGNFVYAHGFGAASADRGIHAAIDAAGNLYIAGSFTGTVDFDPGAGVFSMTSAGVTDAYVAVFAPDGSFVSAVAFGGAGADEASKIALTSDGNLVVAGHFTGAADFDPSAATSSLTSVGPDDVFAAKFTPAGALVWARRLGGASTETLQALATDSAGAIYLGGDFTGTIDVDPGDAVFNLGSGGGGYAVKLDAAGNFAWGKRLGTASPDSVRAIALAPDGRLYLAGRIAAVPFLMQWDAAGNTLWDRRGGPNAGPLQAVAGGVYEVGSFSGTIDFDPGAAVFSLTSNVGSVDAYVTKFGDDGLFGGALRFGGTGDDFAQSITADPAGSIYVSGNFAGVVDFDPGSRTLTRTAAGSADGFVLKLTPAPVFAARPVAVRGGARAMSGAIALTFPAPLTPATAADPANYELRRPGPDGTFDDADDVLVPLTPTYTASGTGITLAPAGLLPPGLYRFTARGGTPAGLRDAGGALIDGDLDGQAGGDFVSTFTVLPPPAVAAAAFSDAKAAHTITVTFTKDVAATLTADDLVVTNSTGAVVTTPRSFQYTPGTCTATWTFGSGGLSDGDYVATIAAAAVADDVGNPLDGNNDGAPGDPLTLSFYHLTADANHDRTVNFDDLVALAQHYNVTDGLRTRADGDFTGDGNVDFDDLVKLAQTYNTSLGGTSGGTTGAAPLSLANAMTAAFAHAPPPAPVKAPVKLPPKAVVKPTAKPAPVTTKPPAPFGTTRIKAPAHAGLGA